MSNFAVTPHINIQNDISPGGFGEAGDGRAIIDGLERELIRNGERTILTFRLEFIKSGEALRARGPDIGLFEADGAFLKGGVYIEELSVHAELGEIIHLDESGYIIGAERRAILQIMKNIHKGEI